MSDQHKGRTADQSETFQVSWPFRARLHHQHRVQFENETIDGYYYYYYFFLNWNRFESAGTNQGSRSILIPQKELTRNDSPRRKSRSLDHKWFPNLENTYIFIHLLMIKDIDILYERDEKGDVKRRNILLAAIEEFLLEKWTHLSCHFFPFNKSDRPLPHAVRSRLINDESKKHGEEPRSIKRNWEGSHAALRMAPLFPRVHHLSRKSPLDKQSNETKLLFLVATASDASLLCDQVRRRSFFFLFFIDSFSVEQNKLESCIEFILFWNSFEPVCKRHCNLIEFLDWIIKSLSQGERINRIAWSDFPEEKNRKKDARLCRRFAIGFPIYWLLLVPVKEFLLSVLWVFHGYAPRYLLWWFLEPIWGSSFWWAHKNTPRNPGLGRFRDLES